MAFLPGNRQIFTVLGRCLGQGLGKGLGGAIKVSKAESQPAPGEEMPSVGATGTLARLDFVSTLMLSFPLEHLCYFKLWVQQGKGKEKKKKEENHFPLANDCIKHFSAAVWGEESGITTPAWEETPPLASPPPHPWKRDAPNPALLAPACSTEQPSCLESSAPCLLCFWLLICPSLHLIFSSGLCYMNILGLICIALE